MTTKNKKTKEEKKIKCPGCEEEYTPKEWEEKRGHFYVEEKEGKEVCEGCYENAFEYACTLMRFSPEGNAKAVFDKYFGILDVGEKDEEINMGRSYPYPVKNTSWISTDAWRGYTDWEYEKGFVNVADGWVTGWPDENMKGKMELSEIYQKLCDEEIIPPIDIYWIFGVTSNIFSTSSDVVIRAGDQEKFNEWIEKINGTAKEFAEKFN